jgi:hypothetical protein
MATPEQWEEKIMPACRCKMVPYTKKLEELFSLDNP